jgi:phosphate transport system substrate-binding protein
MRRTLRGAAVIALLLAYPVSAQDVTLTARDGGLALNGQLISYDGEFYRIDTAYTKRREG